jgi:transposase
VLTAGELLVILDLHQQGYSVSAIARRLNLDRKTVCKYVARGLEPPIYGPRAPRPQIIDPYVEFLRDRLRAFPQLTAIRLLREIQPLGFTGCYAVVKDAVRELRPPPVIGCQGRSSTTG